MLLRKEDAMHHNKNTVSTTCADANILHLQMRYREDILVMNNPRNNENFRHAAYRQYVLWQHGLVA